MTPLDWFQNGALFLLMAKATYVEGDTARGAVSGMLFAVGSVHMIISVVASITT